MALISPGGGSSASGLPTGGASGQVVGYGGSSGTGAWVYPPGYEINYTQITASVNIVSTTESTGTTVFSPGAITFDGGPVLLTFFSPNVGSVSVTGDNFIISLFESTTQIARLAQFSPGTTTAQMEQALSAFYRFTPTAGSHTYTITAFVTATTGTPNVGAGTPGTGAYTPAFIRFTKV